MTREEAKEIIEELYISGTGYCPKGEFVDLCEIIIKALEQEPCDDAISRQAVLDDLEKSHMTSGVRNQDTWNECIDSMMRTVRSMPPINPQPKTGHWIKYDCEYFATGRLTPVTRSIRECSVCHTKISDFCGKMYYCPYCGAKMVEPPESEGKQ